MARSAFFFDSTRCVGCKTCQVACKVKNGLPQGAFYRKVTNYEVGEYPSAGMYHLSIACNHCEDPACLRACPSGAMYREESDGTVQHDDSLCIGCESCAKACPYGAPVYLKDKAIVGKCDACIGTRDEDGGPTCVTACSMRALDFGTYEELAAAHPEAVDALACMPDGGITGPSLFIEARDLAFDAGYRERVL